MTVTYGYQQGGSSFSGVNYNNDYQIRDSSVSYATGVNGVTSVSSLTAEPVTSYETVPMAVTQPTTTTTATTTTGGYDFRVPEGYRIDEFGMLVRAWFDWLLHLFSYRSLFLYFYLNVLLLFIE